MKNNTFDDETLRTITEAAERAASQVVSGQPSASGYKKDFGSEMIGLDKAAKETLAKIYLNRQAELSDPIWVDIFAEWLQVAPKALRNTKEYSPNKLKALAKRYFEKISVGTGDEKKAFDPAATIRAEIENYRLAKAGVSTKW